MPRGKPEKYLDIAKKIQQYIRHNAIPDGKILPSERTLAEKYACTQLTIRKALRKLEQIGKVYKIPSIGNFAGAAPSRNDSNNIVGVLLPFDEPFYFRLFSRLETVFDRLGLYPIVKLTNLMSTKEDNALAFFQNLGVRAIIAVPYNLCVKRYEEMHCPVIFFDNYPQGSSIPHIISDNFFGAFSAVNYLCSLGHKKIAYIGMADERRLDGYLAALKKNGIEADKKYIKRGILTREWGWQAVSECLALDDPPTAVFCGNDTTAAGVMHYCKSKNMQIPDDLSVIGFSNSEVAEDLFLTSVTQHSDKIAATIGEYLSLLLAGKDVPLESVIPTSLIIRDSVAKYV